jgi:ubiquinone/menaquinone biosynthesis C-methylase UbiE
VNQIRLNTDIHDRISKRYMQRHGEIFNEVEQERLRETVRRAIGMVCSGSEILKALDFGCGPGNLTRHLLDLDVNVVAADVSERFLELVHERFATTKLSTLRLNGTDLSGVESNSFDFVGVYSVLHHIPDYISAVSELARVCRPGGIIYLDHEPTEWYWTEDAAYKRFTAEALRFDWRKYLVLGNYVGKVRRLFDPRHSNEGDIHVWKDDHVEWGLLEDTLHAANCMPVLSEDYLLYRKLYRRDVYEKYRGLFADTRVMAFRKH